MRRPALLGGVFVVCACLLSLAQEVVKFKTPQPMVVRLAPCQALYASAAGPAEWLPACAASPSATWLLLSRRVVVQTDCPARLPALMQGRPLRLARVVLPGVFILEAPDARTAAREAQHLADTPGVLASYPVLRQPVDPQGPYARRPTDTFFANQWPLEHRDGDGSVAGVDLNARAAWPLSTGRGVTLAIADRGVELTHPEFAGRVTDAPHFNFDNQTPNGQPTGTSANWAHGTEVAGLAAAGLNNARVVGVAPDAHLAGWVIFATNGIPVSDERLMDMFAYASNVVAVQNHSWTHVGLQQRSLTLLEDIGISNAVTFGRDGRGVVLVRAAGNDRAQGANANDDGYCADPRVITVGAVRLDGRVASYSEPGACLLVAAPSGDPDAGFEGLLTTDLLGTNGINQLSFFPPFQDMNGYVWGYMAFSGTSAAAPQIAGLAALVLAANPALTAREVQQILALAARHFDLADPDLRPNGAGLLVSHNTGFGVPDAGEAVRLARLWRPRPPLVTVTFTATNLAEIPDAGFRLCITGSNVPPDLAALLVLPSLSPQAEAPTPALPLVFVGTATNPLALNLTNCGALVERSGNDYVGPLLNAARAGAAFVVMHNFATNASGVGTPGGEQFAPMLGTEFVPLPSGFITYSAGLALRQWLTHHPEARAQLRLVSTGYVFQVTNTLLCERIGLRVKTDHPMRSDVRITLDSPAGTRSVLQRLNSDMAAGPVDWTYDSTHHFLEGSAGDWTVAFSDEFIGNTGRVTEVSLILRGVPIQDADGDGLDDAWELAYAADLETLRPDSDPDGDGASNAREHLLGTNPLADETPLTLDFSLWNAALARVSWPGSDRHVYACFSADDLGALAWRTNIPGRFPETEWFVPYTNAVRGFYRICAQQQP